MKLLITGGSGFLGSRILQYYRERYTCFAPTHQELDITDEKQCRDVLREFWPDFVIHTAAVSDVGACEDDPEMSWKVNVQGTIHLAKACEAAGSRLIFMSSDQVYTANHTALPNAEDTICEPVPQYGKQKWEAEQEILKISPDAIALRLSWMYDLPSETLDTKPNFLTRILSAIENGTEIAFSDSEYRGITYVREVVELLENLFFAPGGVYNFGSPTAETTYELAQKVFRMLGEDEKMVRLLKRADAMQPRSLAMTLDRLRQLGILFPENVEGVRRCLNDYGIL